MRKNITISMHVELGLKVFHSTVAVLLCGGLRKISDFFYNACRRLFLLYSSLLLLLQCSLYFNNEYQGKA
jgi:hypothetical protein